MLIYMCVHHKMFIERNNKKENRLQSVFRENKRELFLKVVELS